MDQGNNDMNTPGGLLHGYLRGLNFPAERIEVIRTLESNGAMPDMLYPITNAVHILNINSLEEVSEVIQRSRDFKGFQNR